MQKFVRRVPVIEACQHDGSNDSALKLEAWVLSEGGIATAHLIGSIDYAQNNAFVHIGGDRPQNLVGPGAWVVQAAGKFYAVPDVDFQLLYKPEEEN